MKKNTCVREFTTTRYMPLAGPPVEIKGCFALYNDPPEPPVSSIIPHSVVRSLIDSLAADCSFPQHKFVDFDWDIPILGKHIMPLRGYYWVTSITEVGEKAHAQARR